MGTTNNWVKDGLDAYLGLTESKRRDDMAASEIANRNEYTRLAQNQDARSATQAGLINQNTQLDINQKQYKVDERKRVKAARGDWVDLMAFTDPSIPNTNDPAAIAKARQDAMDLAHTGVTINNMPAGSGEFTLDKLPASAQKVLMEGPGKAAQNRAGTVHTDPSTGQKYTMTGQMGKVRYVKEEGKPAMIVPTMLAQNEDGTLREVPYTNGKSNDPNDPVKYVTPEMLTHRAGATLNALKIAEEENIIPSIAYAASIKKMMAGMTDEEQDAWWKGEMANRAASQKKYVSDTALETAAKPIRDQIAALTGTTEEKRKKTLALLAGKPPELVDNIVKTAKAIDEMFPMDKKTNTTVETAEGVYAFDTTAGKRGDRLGGLKPTSSGSGGELPADAKMIEYYKRMGASQDEAERKAGAAKENPAKLTLDTFNHLKTGQKDMGPKDPGYKTDEELMDEADRFVKKFLVRTAAKEKTPPPAASGMEGDASKHMPLKRPSANSPTSSNGVGAGMPQPAQNNYGNRPDGTKKGNGYLGALKMTDGSGKVATEMTIGVKINGKETDIPLIVPTLSQPEIDSLLAGGKPTKQMVKKASDHAKKRIRDGKSPYVEDQAGQTNIDLNKFIR